MAHDVGEWLEGLELGTYAEVFVENGVDLRALLHLSEDDLKELGVLLGHRRILLSAIASLRDQEGAPQGKEQASEPSSRSEAERRQLTVMFVDLVGSTALSAALDPEDLRNVMRRYQDAVAGAVTRYGGYVAKYLGDGVLAYFGWPQAHEDQAERAVRAGLDAVAAVGNLILDDGVELKARVGIATGNVVVGDLVGEVGRDAEAVSGETPNLAARLQEFAGAGQVAIGAATRRLIGEAFELEDLGPQALKGFAEAVPMWRVTGERPAESRFEAAHAGRLAAFVGREEEVDLLVKRWQQATGGEGQVVLLSGEAGIGKSRITQTLGDRIADQSPMRLRFQCSPHHANSALYPFISQLERASDIAPADGPDARLDKLEALLSQSTEDVTRVASLFGALLSIPTGDRYPPLGLAPQLQKERTQEALVDQLLGLAARHPVLMIFEDVHWADPTTLEALELVIDRVQDARVLGVITHRPEFAPPWHGHSHVTALALNRLGRDHCAAMVPDVARGKALPVEVLDEIVAKTDGVPLFVEELTKTVIESGILEEKADRYELSGPLPPLAIPSTLQDSLMARLDRLAPIKEVAQIGAAIGREFSQRLLAEVSSKGDNELNDALGQLVESELVFRRGRPPDATYVFKHALIQDAAYQSLLRSKRQTLHRDIAGALEQSFPETAETEPEILAHHYTEAGLAEQAVGYWRRAGQRAVEHSANVEAIAHLTKGLELFSSLPDASERPQVELALQAALGVALMAAKGYAASETGEALMRARDLCREVGDTPQSFEVLYGVWNYTFTAGDHDAARDLAEECLNLVQDDGERSRLVAAHSALGQTLVALGRLDTAQDHLEKSVAFYEPEEDRSLCLVYGEDPAIGGLTWLVWALWFRGFPEQAEVRLAEALGGAQELSHAVTTGICLNFAAGLRCFVHEPKTAQDSAQAAIDYSIEQNLPLFSAWGAVLRGWAVAEQRHPEQGIAEMHRGLEEWRGTGAKILVPLFHALLAQGYARCGKFEDGLKSLDDAFDAFRRNGEKLWEAELHRLKGELLLSISDGNGAEAETCFKKAIEIARGQSAKSFELRAAMSLARLWQGEGKRSEARDLLAPVYDWFTEGFDTTDLKEAKALLDDLT